MFFGCSDRTSHTAKQFGRCFDYLSILITSQVPLVEYGEPIIAEAGLKLLGNFADVD
jgi:hypothetical protein